MPSSTAHAYADHVAWLSTLRAAHARHAAEHSRRSEPLPAAPMRWAMFDEANGPGPLGRAQSGGAAFESEAAHAFSNIALSDEDFDAPVYRSLSGIFSTGPTGSVDYEDDDALAPVYRGLGGFPGLGHGDATPDDADSEWLQTMPPLVQRQRARGASLAIMAM